MTPDHTRLIEALRCGNPTCQCHANGSGKYMLHCPAHADVHKPNLSVEVKKDTILFHDFAGCPQDAVIGKLREMGLWPGGGSQQNSTTTGPASGLTLQQYADAKHLPIDFLKSLSLSDCKVHGAPAVRVPYLDENRHEIGMRYRLSLKVEPRFSWRKGSKSNLYGLWRLDEIRRSGWVLIVEGESDCHTLWHHKLPGLGVPGKGNWRSAWKDYLDGLAAYLWEEPNAEDFARRVGKDIPTLRVITAPGSIKDVSEAHILGYDLSVWLEGLKASATPFEFIVGAETQRQLAELERQAAHIFAHADPLELVKVEIGRMGYGGDVKPALIVYCASTSRVIAPRPGSMPVHCILLSIPSAGKSYTINTVRRLFPEELFHVIDAGSPRALIYDRADLRHRVVVFAEADSIPSGEDNPAASAIRNLLQEGRLAYSVVVRDEQTGEFTTKEIDKPGPTVLITTATRRLGEQLMTRFFTLEIADEPGQVRAALQKQAQIELDGVSDPDDGLIAFQSYLQLRAPWNVYVPYADSLAKLIGNSMTAPRILRDFARLLSLIKSVAILRHRHRQVDSSRRIIAQIEDYATVRELVGQMYADSLSGSTKRIREVVKCVATLRKQDAQKFVSVTQLADNLKINKMSASRRVNAALKSGWLVNHEARKGFPAQLDVGEPLPSEEGLPEPDTLRDRCNTVTGLTDGYGDAVPVPPAFEVVEI